MASASRYCPSSNNSSTLSESTYSLRESPWVSPDCPPDSGPRPRRPRACIGFVICRRAVFFARAGFFFAAFFPAGFFFAASFFFTAVFPFAIGFFLAAGFFFRVGFFLLTIFFLRAGFFLAMRLSLSNSNREIPFFVLQKFSCACGKQGNSILRIGDD